MNDHQCKPNNNSRFSREDLAPFNLLSQPVWVFDIDNKAMWWANDSALVLWNADSLESLLSRDFAEDMSDATAQTLAEYLSAFRNGNTVTTRWTYYPTGKGPTTVDVLLSGMHNTEGRLLMLNEGHIVPKDEIDQASLRGVEMLKHLPVSICQFDVKGRLMHQNPEALAVFGNPLENKKKRKATSATNSMVDFCHFRSRFVDEQLGERIFDEVVNRGNDYCVDAQQYTKLGIRWGSIKVRCARDPVTGDPSILYSARDITDVVNAKKEADEANARKSEFIAVMAHEIRTPLHQVIGTIDLLGQTSLSTEQTDFVNLLQGGALSLMAVINDLLDYTKLEAGKMELEYIPLDARAVVDGSVAAVSSRAEAKGLEVETYIEQSIQSEFQGDPNRLRQILLNLLSNAVKFTNSGKIVTRVKENTRESSGTSSRLRFEVEDTGIGIGVDFQKELFGKYHQADPNVAREYGGTGLGLAICDRLVNMMGGDIGVESQVGKGSLFWFELNFNCYENQQQPTMGRATVVGAQNAGDDDCLRVLVAEDNKVNQKVVSAMLKRLGHMPTVVENGLMAVEKASSEKFDMVLMDIQMPVLDGIEATKRIRSNSISCPVIGLSASFQRTELPFYRDVGMTDCISKPVRLEGLRRTIHENRKDESPIDILGPPNTAR